MQNSGAKCRHRWVEWSRNTRFYRITVIPNVRIFVTQSVAKGPVKFRYAIQDFTGSFGLLALRMTFCNKN